MMRSHGAANNRVPVTMMPNFRVLLDKTAHEIASCLAARVGLAPPRERRFRSRFVTSSPRRQKNDRRQQIVQAEGREQCRRRHFRHPNFHLKMFYKRLCRLMCGKAMPYRNEKNKTRRATPQDKIGAQPRRLETNASGKSETFRTSGGTAANSYPYPRR